MFFDLVNSSIKFLDRLLSFSLDLLDQFLKLLDAFYLVPFTSLTSLTSLEAVLLDPILLLLEVLVELLMKLLIGGKQSIEISNSLLRISPAGIQRRSIHWSRMSGWTLALE